MDGPGKVGNMTNLSQTTKRGEAIEKQLSCQSCTINFLGSDIKIEGEFENIEELVWNVAVMTGMEDMTGNFRLAILGSRIPLNDTTFKKAQQEGKNTFEMIQSDYVRPYQSNYSARSNIQSTQGDNAGGMKRYGFFFMRINWPVGYKNDSYNTPSIWGFDPKFAPSFSSFMRQVRKELNVPLKEDKSYLLMRDGKLVLNDETFEQYVFKNIEGTKAQFDYVRQDEVSYPTFSYQTSDGKTVVIPEGKVRDFLELDKLLKQHPGTDLDEDGVVKLRGVRIINFEALFGYIDSTKKNTTTTTTTTHLTTTTNTSPNSATTTTSTDTATTTTVATTGYSGSSGN